MILILAHSGDDHTKGVLSEISRRKHPTAFVDSSHFPSQASLNLTFSTNELGVEYNYGGHRINLNNCRAAWWRRPQPYTLHDDLDPDMVSFVYSECHEAFSGALAIPKATWVNPPHLDERAHHKPLQLATALNVGLVVPRTLITNDPVEARRFITEIGLTNTIYKTFLATPEHWRETRVMRQEELNLLESVCFAPVIFQEYINSEFDIRVTIVGDKIFATAIRSNPDGYSLDYRMDMDAATFSPMELPGHITDALLALMASLGIVYGAVDLLYTKEGQYIFLEVNPAGEWRFVEDRTAQPITAAMANLLIRFDSPEKEIL